MRCLLRLLLSLVILFAVLAVAAFFLLDKVVKEVMESRLRHVTGMETEISEVEVGILSPVITIKGLKLYNTPDFGGSIFLDMPELHLEYDPFAFRSSEIHLKLVRLNLAELSLIQDKKGRMNIQEFKKRGADEIAGGKTSRHKFKFDGIDTLVLTLGKMRISNEASGREEEINFGVTNQVIRNVKSEADLAGLSLLMAMRGGALSSPTNSGVDLKGLLKNLVH